MWHSFVWLDGHQEGSSSGLIISVTCSIFRHCIHGDNENPALVQDIEGSNKLISDHLKSNGDLKSLPEIVSELEVTSQQQVQSLKELVVKKEDALQVIHRENWSLMNKLDNVMAELEQTVKREKQKLIDHKEGKVVHFLLRETVINTYNVVIYEEDIMKRL
jgi:ribosome-associated translation inhibitor RaiA